MPPKKQKIVLKKFSKLIEIKNVIINAEFINSLKKMKVSYKVLNSIIIKLYYTIIIEFSH